MSITTNLSTLCLVTGAKLMTLEASLKDLNFHVLHSLRDENHAHGGKGFLEVEDISITLFLDMVRGDATATGIIGRCDELKTLLLNPAANERAIRALGGGGGGEGGEAAPPDGTAAPDLVKFNAQCIQEVLRAVHCTRAGTATLGVGHMVLWPKLAEAVCGSLNLFVNRAQGVMLLKVKGGGGSNLKDLKVRERREQALKNEFEESDAAAVPKSPVHVPKLQFEKLGRYGE